MSWFLQFIFQIKNLKTQWICFLLIDNDESHHVYIKDFNRFIFHKTKNKKWFCRSCLQGFSNKNVLMRHKEDCLSTNGAQYIKVEKGTIEFKQIAVPFKIYADFEFNLKGVESYEGSSTKKISSSCSL